MQSALLTMRVLWAALSAATVAIAAIGWLVPATGAQGAPPVFVPVFGALAVSIAVASFLLPAHATRAGLGKMKDLVVEEPDPDVVGFYREGPPMRRVIRLSAAHVQRLRAVVQPAFIVSLALSESISLLGLVLTRLGESVAVAAPFFVAGTALSLFRYPTMARLRASLERALGARVIDEHSVATGT